MDQVRANTVARVSGAVGAWRRSPRVAITWGLAPTVTVLLLACIFALLWLDTRPLDVNDGFGYDGLEYARLALSLRSGTPMEIDSPQVYRVVAPAIVALSGLEVRLGFFVLNVAADLGSGLLLLVLLKRYGAAPGAAVLAIVWWGVLPFALRKELHTPVLVDAVSFFVLTALLLAAIARQHLLFAVLLAVGVLTRESLLLVAPFLILRAVPLGWRVTATAAAAVIPALAALTLIHVAPPAPPRPGSLDTAAYLAFHSYLIAANIDGDALRALLGPLFGLGGLLSVALGRLRALRQLLATEPGWLYLLIAISTAATIGGLDHDRHVLEVAPILLLVGFAGTARGFVLLLAAPLTLLHVVATRSLVPLSAGETAHRSVSLSTMPESDLLAAAAWPFVAVVAIALLTHRFDRRGSAPVAAAAGSSS